MNFIKINIGVFILLILHELGHIIVAKILNLPIQKIGFLLRPYPHFYVTVKWPQKRQYAFIYLFSGTFVTMTLFIISIINNFFNLSFLFWTFVIQLIIETNPFYSDFTIMTTLDNLSNRKNLSASNYKKLFKEYQFTAKWYCHFILWGTLILLLFKLKTIIL
tara:strand:+ start:259 stop:744 length:486 start_codon:yes stop_codon:yes gene_type:complete